MFNVSSTKVEYILGLPWKGILGRVTVRRTPVSEVTDFELTPPTLCFVIRCARVPHQYTFTQLLTRGALELRWNCVGTRWNDHELAGNNGNLL